MNLSGIATRWKRIFFFLGVLAIFSIFSAGGVWADSTSFVLNTNTRKFHDPSCSSVQQMSPKNRQDTSMSYEEIISLGYSPCKNCNPRPEGGMQMAAASMQSARSSASYVLNTNTRKIHMPNCSSVTEMKKKNRADTDKSYGELIAEGYEPCKKCNPY